MLLTSFFLTEQVGAEVQKQALLVKPGVKMYSSIVLSCV